MLKIVIKGLFGKKRFTVYLKKEGVIMFLVFFGVIQDLQLVVRGFPCLGVVVWRSLQANGRSDGAAHELYMEQGKITSPKMWVLSAGELPARNLRDSHRGEINIETNRNIHIFFWLGVICSHFVTLYLLLKASAGGGLGGRWQWGCCNVRKSWCERRYVLSEPRAYLLAAGLC